MSNLDRAALRVWLDEARITGRTMLIEADLLAALLAAEEQLRELRTELARLLVESRT